MVSCPSCQHTNPDGARFCNACGAPLVAVCPACSHNNPPESRFCNACGHQLAAAASAQLQPRFDSPQAYTPKYLADKILTSRSALEGERKQVTVLFCDIANSTPLAERLGPEAMHTLLNHFFELALDTVHRYEGTVNQFLGDGFMVLFGAPLAHEDHARRAVIAALDLQRRLHEPSVNLPLPAALELAVRMGLHTGLVVVGRIGDNLRMDYTAVGDTTNLAARLQQLAEPGTILISDTTARLVQGAVRLEAMPPTPIRGKRQPVHVYTVRGASGRRSPLARLGEQRLSDLAGRARELATLEDVFAHVEDGQGQVVGVVGEAGVGKSRLLYEFRQRLAGKGVTYLDGRCLSYGSTMPYHPILDIVRHNCGLTEADTPESSTAKVRQSLHEVGMEPDESAPYLLWLLGIQAGTERLAVLTPEAMKTRIFATLRQMSLNGSQRQPLVYEVEDLHWIDKTSEDYLGSMVENLAGAAIMLLVTYRPGYHPVWLDRSYATQIALRRLTEQESRQVVQSVAQGTELPAPLVQTILEKAEGNPFFLEELTRVVVEHGTFQGDMAVPETIQGILAARIDRLPEAAKQLVQTASVLGREFSLRLLEAIWDGPEALEALLPELKRLEFLYERTGTDEPVYIFKHALTQEVAYDSLLTPRRQALHAAAGQALERHYAERLADVHDRLAYHYARTDNAAKAVTYLMHMAEKVARGFAHTEALTVLEEALVHAERLLIDARDQRLVALWTRQLESLFWVGHHQEAIRLHQARQARVEHTEDHALIGCYYIWLSRHYILLGEHDQAVQSAQRALAEGQQGQDDIIMGMAYTWLCVEDYFAGRPLQASEHGRRAVALLERTAERYWLGFANQMLAYSYYFIGDYARALEATARAEAIAETIGDRRLSTAAAGIRGWSLATRGDYEAGVTACQGALERAPDAFETAILLGFLGYAYLEQGHLAEAIPVLEQAVKEAVRYRSRQVQSWFYVYLAEAYRLHGQLEPAQQYATQGYELASSIQHRWGAALAQRTLGRLAHTHGRLTEAVSLLQQALDTFTTIHSRFEAARTHLDLATLAHTQGNQEAVMRHLTEAHALFTALQVPKYVERAVQLASELGVSL